MTLRLGDFRALIPSWLFFDDATDGHEIFVRSGSELQQLGSWEIAFPKRIIRNWSHLFYAPETNFQLYRISCFESLIEHSQDYLENPEGLLKTECYQLCLDLLRESHLGCEVLQFKIGDFFVSPVHRRNG